MSSNIQLWRRNPGVGSPADSAGKAGNIAVAFPAAVGGVDQKPEIWLHNGTKWLQSNKDPNVTVGNAVLPPPSGATAGSKTGIGAAWTALTPKPTDPIVIASFNGGAYVKIGAGGADADWVSLGSAMSFAVTADITTGTDLTKALNSGALRGASRSTPTGGAGPAAADANHFVLLDTTGAIDPKFIKQPAPAGAGGVGGDVATVVAGVATNMFLTPAGLEMRVAHTPNATPANDQNKLPALDATGKIPVGFLPAGGLQFTGNKDLTVPYVAPAAGAAPKNGDLAFVSKAGAVDASWNAVLVNPPATVGVGDMLVYEGGTVNKWHITASDVDVSGYVSKAGTSSMAANAKLDFTATPPVAGATILDGGANAPKIENVTLDCGTY